MLQDVNPCLWYIQHFIPKEIEEPIGMHYAASGETHISFIRFAQKFKKVFTYV